MTQPPRYRSGKKLRRDLKVLARFIDVYCRYHHADAQKIAVQMKTHDIQAIWGRKLTLCEDCCKLLAHAFVKRSGCLMTPKPACKRCPRHCYHPAYRQQIRQVMTFAGRKMLLTNGWDYLRYWLF